MKVLYRGALVLWLVSGFAIHAYYSRTLQGTADAQPKQGLQVGANEHDARTDAGTHLFGAYAAWAAVGFVLALRGVHLLFRAADRVADVEKFLAAPLLMIFWAGVL